MSGRSRIERLFKASRCALVMVRGYAKTYRLGDEFD